MGVVERGRLGRPPVRGGAWGWLATVSLAALLLASGPAEAQSPTLNDSLANRARGDGTSRLLVEADELVYDNDRNTVSARGNVQLNYQGRTLQADRVVYDRGTGRVLAEGNARLTEANGTVATGERFELTEDFKTGFIDSLRVTQPTVDQGRPVTTRFSAPRAERIEGETTVFERGTYTACEPCRDNPERPPLWQVKAARIIHNNAERTVYYENATLEVAGIPVVYLPYFWSPDPTVRRKTGFLAPTYVASSALGTGVAVPFFWNLAPNYDLTLTPTYYSRQGVLGQAEWRHRLETGVYNIRAAGIFQSGDGVFLPPPLGPRGREGRGSIESTGLFYLNERWRLGWDVALLSDKWFLQNYRIRSESVGSNYFQESTSTAFLRGQGDRSFFDLRGYYFKGLSSTDWQKQQAVVHPVLDYNKRVDGPAPLGGELAIDVNFTSLTREAADFVGVRNNVNSLFFFPVLDGFPTGLSLYETCLVYERGICLVRGTSGTNTRVSTQLSWRRNFIDPAGQVWTPFAYARLDGFFTRPDTNGYVNNQLPRFIGSDDDFAGRVLPAVGLQYRFPLVVDAGASTTQVVEPIAQVIARPNEGRIGRLPNDDSHSVIFDDTSLFDWDRFAGYDRVEGGTRADLGVKYSITGQNGFYADALFGQSYHLAGRNSFEKPDLLNAGLNSGLEQARSDYVARLHLQPNQAVRATARARLDEDNFELQRFDAALTANFAPTAPLSATLAYARYEAQPAYGLPRRREGLSLGSNLQLGGNWSVSGSVLFDLSRYLRDRELYAARLQPYLADLSRLPADVTYERAPYTHVAGYSVGAAYNDECTTFSVTYTSSFKDQVITGAREPNKTLAFRLELRTLGATTVRQTLGDDASRVSDGIAN